MNDLDFETEAYIGDLITCPYRGGFQNNYENSVVFLEAKNIFDIKIEN